MFLGLTKANFFQDKLDVAIIDSQTKTISLHAYGFGTTIVSEPEMTSNLVLGPHFSQTAFSKTFTLTNKGRRHQQLVWSCEGYSYTKALKKAMSAKSVRL